VLFCGLAVAALRNASDLWASLVFLATLGLLATALVGILQRRARARAFWQGFALFGWGYLVVAFGPWFADSVAPKLPTSHLIGYAHSKVVRDEWRLATILYDRSLGAANHALASIEYDRAIRRAVVRPPAPEPDALIFSANDGTLVRRKRGTAYWK